MNKRNKGLCLLSLHYIVSMLNLCYINRKYLLVALNLVLSFCFIEVLYFNCSMELIFFVIKNMKYLYVLK